MEKFCTKKISDREEIQEGIPNKGNPPKLHYSDSVSSIETFFSQCVGTHLPVGI